MPPSARNAETRRVLRRVFYLNLAVVGVKVAAWVVSGALSVLAEVTHSSLDAVNNLFALAFARIAGREPDRRHPYGHQKFETLGALVLVGLLSITVFELARSAVLKLVATEPPDIQATPLAVGLVAAGAVVGILVSAYEFRRGRQLGSDLLLADAAHTRSDVLTSLGVLAGLFLIRAGIPKADAWVTLAVAGAIAWTGWRIVREAVPVLVDERTVPPEVIRQLAESDDEVRSCYRIRSRGRRGEAFCELTIAVDASFDVSRSHAVADRVEMRVSQALGAREVVVHVEPAS